MSQLTLLGRRAVPARQSAGPGAVAAAPAVNSSVTCPWEPSGPGGSQPASQTDRKFGTGRARQQSSRVTVLSYWAWQSLHSDLRELGSWHSKNSEGIIKIQQAPNVRLCYITYVGLWCSCEGCEGIHTNVRELKNGILQMLRWQ